MFGSRKQAHMHNCSFRFQSDATHWTRREVYTGTPRSSSQPVGLNGRVRQKAWEMWRHHEPLPLSRGTRHKEAKAKKRGRRKDITTISQRATRIVEGASTKEDEDVACPRCDHELHVFNTASGPIMRCRGWNLAVAPCTLIKACQDGAVVPGGLTGTLSGQDNGVQDPPPIDDWTAQVKALLQTQRGRKNNSPSSNFINNINTFNINRSSWRRRQRTLGERLPRMANPLGTSGVWIRERIGLVCNRPIQHNVRVRKRESSTGLVW